LSKALTATGGNWKTVGERM